MTGYIFTDIGRLFSFPITSASGNFVPQAPFIEGSFDVYDRESLLP